MRSKSRPRRRWTSYTLLQLSIVVALCALDGDLPRSAATSAMRFTVPSPVAVTEPAPVVISPFVPTTPVTGSIVDGAGRPIAGVRVSIREAPGAAADSDASGEFRVAAPIAPQHTLLFDGPYVFPAEVAWRVGQPAPRILLARRARLEARVTANDMPMAGAEVNLTDGSRPTLATAIADRDGIARFENLLPGPYELWARRDTWVSALVRVGDVGGESQPEVVLALEASGSIRGEMLAEDKLPAGATVTLAPVDLDHAVRVATVDATGRFGIDGVPRGRWRVEGEAAGYVQSGEQFVEARYQRDETAVRMQRAGVIAGTVIDSAGAPVTNATIVVRPQGVQAALADDRRMVVSSTRLRWVHPLAGRRVLPGREGLRFGASRPGARPAECGQGHCGVDIGWQRGTVIHASADGEVVLAHVESHSEAGRAIVIDHGQGLRTYYMHLDELRGGLEVGQRVRAGDALGTMGSTGFSSGPHLHFAITQERVGRTWYLDPEPILQHAVVLPAPRALDPIDGRNATVIAALRQGDGHTNPTQPAQTITTDARGRFRVDGIAPGMYVAVAFAPELAPGTSNAFAVRTGGETGDVTITLRPGVLVLGRVLGRDGPITGASIVAGAGVGESAHKVATTQTFAQGEYTLRALTGKITLSVTAPGYGVIERTIMLGDGAASRLRESAHREDFVLVVESSELRGQVLAPDGGSAGVVALRVVEGPTRRRVVTDASGRFAITSVATGTYVLEAAAADYPVTRMTLQTEKWTEVRLERGGSVRCELRDALSAAPLSGIRVEATGPGNRTASFVTDARGVADLRALTIGDWTVTARAKGYTDAKQVVTVRPTSVPHDLRLDLSRGVTLAGVVRDRYGRRVAGARVWTDGVTTQTDADGNFRLADAPAGTHWLEAELEGSRGAVQLQLVPGDERLTLSIELTQ
jgi:murein DD-endopeptidase MepM/ murein hydrolase activator NlpD